MCICVFVYLPHQDIVAPSRQLCDCLVHLSILGIYLLKEVVTCIRLLTSSKDQGRKNCVEVSKNQLCKLLALETVRGK